MIARIWRRAVEAATLVLASYFTIATWHEHGWLGVVLLVATALVFFESIMLYVRWRVR